MSVQSRPLSGVLLMTYGSPASLDDVPRYLAAVRGGRAAEPELLVEFTRRYRVIGGSPLVEITAAQAAALERHLGSGWTVETGMRFSPPSIRDGLERLSGRGAVRVAAIIMSPQYSDLIMGGYLAAVADARAALGSAAPEVRVAGPWHTEPAFLGAVADRIAEALGSLPERARSSTPVLLTAHSLPRRVAEREPGYIAQLRETAELIASAAGLEEGRWRFCWQSAGHEPGEWMTPDFADLMPELAREGHRTVVVAPIQFLADHLETLYDVNIGAREQAIAAGMAFQAIQSLNVAPRFIEALAAVATRTLEGAAVAS
jgi:ferrochelatase